MRDLEAYRSKRDPARTPEPFGAERPAVALHPAAPRRFVVQQHAARRIHYDLRLEIDGALVSWAVPKGPSLDPKERRLAVRTEDHPLEYATFEGVIPAGNYGAGAMIVWDQGTYRTQDARAPAEGLEAGKLDLVLAGHKLRGRFALVRTRAGGGKDWLLLRKGTASERDPVQDAPASVLSGLTVGELREGAHRDAQLATALERAGAPQRALDREALRPMLATAEKQAFSRAGWLFEVKHDGVRVLLVKDGGEVRVLARTGGDRARIYPEVARAAAHLPLSRFAIDGEVVALDETGRSSFERIQQRFTLVDPGMIARAEVEVPLVYYAFDLLGALGFDLRGLPLEKRKELLASFVPRAGVIGYADHLEREGEKLFEAAAARGLEGVIAKRADSRYESGRRSRSWIKIKAPRTARLAVVGWTAGQGTRSRMGAVLLAGRRGEQWIYAGGAGSGLSDAIIGELLPQLEAGRVAKPPCSGVPRPPPRGARWTRPEIVCEVRYTELTSAGLLRQPVFLGVRPEARLEHCLSPAPLTPSAEPLPLMRAPAAPPAPAEPKLTRLDKVFWPDEGYTKGDLLAYYEAVWPWLGPYLRDRPVVLTRYPDGIAGKNFFQKNAPDFTPDWVLRQRIDDTDYFLCNQLRTLLYVINSGAIPLHVWSARAASLENPDWLILDLDPKGAPFAHVVRVARHIHGLLGELSAPHFVKTSGQDGLHVMVPLGASLDHEGARALAEALARVVCAELPEIATIVRPVAARGGKVYVDYLQNGRGKLIAAPFSVRPRGGAPVSMPLAWSRIGARLDPARFTIGSAPALLQRSGDPLSGVLTEPIDLEALLGGLEQRLAATRTPRRRRRG